MVGGRSSEKRDGTTVARLEESSSRPGVLFEPLVFVDCTPCQDAPDYDSPTNGRAGEVAVCTQEQTPMVSHAEMAEPFNCADVKAAAAKRWAVERLGHFADMH